MWWNKSYVHRRDWMISQFENLSISHEELVVLLIIDMLNESKKCLTPFQLQQATKLDEKKFDQVLHRLMSKKILEIKTNKKQLEFNIDAVFKTSNPYDDVKHDLLFAFEKEFGRPLSQQELLKLNELSQAYDESLIIYGLREAIINQKLSMNYIERVVKSKE